MSEKSASCIRSAFILAAGRGERLRPLTDRTPKPLLKVKGKPLLEWALLRLSTLKGLERVVINAWHLAEQIESFAFEVKDQFKFEILISKEEELLGTGGGLKRAFPLLKQTPFLVVNSDLFWEGDLQKFVDFCSIQSRFDHIWWLTEPQSNESRIKITKDFEIEQIGSLWSRPQTHETFKEGCFSGIQYFRNLWVDRLPEKGCIIRNYFVPLLTETKIRMGGSFEGLQTWADIGTPERLKAFTGG